jgi:hypothetical protein
MEVIDTQYEIAYIKVEITLGQLFRLNLKEINSIEHSNSIETEASMIISSEDPKKKADEIVQEVFLGYYKLLLIGTQIIHDIYFDTHDDSLQDKKVSLRIRSIDKKNWITIKGSSDRTACGTANRLKIEEPWSKDSLTKAFTNLSERGIKMPPINQKLEGEPVHVLKNIIGMKEIQNRITTRNINMVWKYGIKKNL